MTELEKAKEEYKKLGEKIKSLESKYDNISLVMKTPASWTILNNGQIQRNDTTIVDAAQKFGMKYHTEEDAKEASDQMKALNIIRYHSHLLNRNWTLNWNDDNQKKYYIAFNKHTNKWESDYTIYSIRISVYMSEIAAEKLCRKLNKEEK